MYMFNNAKSLQLGKQQDHAVSGVYKDGYYIGVMDGHGNDTCVDILRNIFYDTIAEADDSAFKIFQTIQYYNIKQDLYGSGSTFNFTKICVTDELTITNYNIGDSETVVFINGDVIFRSQVHSIENKNERIRVKSYLEERGGITIGWAPLPISENRITNTRSDVCNFKTGESIVPTQSLGHNNMTGYSPDVYSFTCKLTDHVRIVSGSDGFWNMIIKNNENDMDKVKTMKLDELLAFAEMRWKKEWEFASNPKTPDNIIITSFPDYDDISVAIWDNKYEM